MSVPKGDRKEAESEFIHTARELQALTIRRCVSFPKRYTFYLGQQMAQISGRVYEYVICANSIYPTKRCDYELRRNYLTMARSETRALVSQIELAGELFGLSHDGDQRADIGERVERWAELAYREIRLIDGVMRRDAERFGSLPE